MLSIIILIVIPSIPKAVSWSIAIPKAARSPVTLLVHVFVSETFTHTSHNFLSHFVDPTTLSSGYNSALTK